MIPYTDHKINTDTEYCAHLLHSVKLTGSFAGLFLRSNSEKNKKSEGSDAYEGIKEENIKLKKC